MSVTLAAMSPWKSTLSKPRSNLGSRRWQCRNPDQRAEPSRSAEMADADAVIPGDRKTIHPYGSAERAGAGHCAEQFCNVQAGGCFYRTFLHNPLLSLLMWKGSVEV